MVDINKVLKDVVKKGTVHMGEKRTKAAIKEGKARLIIIANNCPYTKELITAAKDKNIPSYTASSNSVELGTLCGKGYTVSAFAVLDEGDSNIVQFISKRK